MCVITERSFPLMFSNSLMIIVNGIFNNWANVSNKLKFMQSKHRKTHENFVI